MSTFYSFRYVMMTEGGWGLQTAIYFNAELSPQCLPLISKPAEQLMNSWKPHVHWWWHWKRSLEGRACSFCQEPNNGSAYRFQARRLLARVCVCVCVSCVRGRGFALRCCMGDKATPTRPCLNEITVKAKWQSQSGNGVGSKYILAVRNGKWNMVHKMETETQ